MKELAQKYELGKCMEKCIYSNRYILFYFKDEELESLCQAVEKDYGFTKVRIIALFKGTSVISVHQLLSHDQPQTDFHAGPKDRPVPRLLAPYQRRIGADSC